MQIQYGQRGGRSVGTAGCLQPRLQHGDISDTAAGTAASANPGRILALAQHGSAARRWQQGWAQPWSVGAELGRQQEAGGQQTPMCCAPFSTPQRSLGPGGSSSQQPHPFQDAFPTNHPPKHAARFDLTGRRDAAQRRTRSVKLLQGRESRGPSWL